MEVSHDGGTKYAQYINVLGIGSTAGDVKRVRKAAQRALSRNNIFANVAGYGLRRTYTALLYELASIATRGSVYLIWKREVPGSIRMVVVDFSGWVTLAPNGKNTPCVLIRRRGNKSKANNFAKNQLTGMKHSPSVSHVGRLIHQIAGQHLKAF
ncbi:hypothetical protein DPMN_033230 [Dreissena polymorpha]|uniref:Uncharacterized protein n=1 Tax=Dreissena polymorpha TaxID=45954 RepID=A0A9D4M5N5_DREPO|nr:hypothetical protein DPMN_033230 [Dreissena polymorpha]